MLVLIVVDSGADKLALSSLLQDDGWEVRLASSNEILGVIAYSSGREPDVILLAIIPNRLDPLVALGHINHDAEWRQIPLVILNCGRIRIRDKVASPPGTKRRVCHPSSDPHKELPSLLRAATEL